MYYGTIKKFDIANGEGVRVTLFVSGCRNHCKNCFQPQTWDFDYGEPFEPENQRALVPFLRRVRERYPQKTIWSFSGFTLEELKDENCRGRCEVTDEMLSLLDVLVDGRFVEELKNISLRFRGSSNQRLIDMNETRRQGKIVLWDR
ncbi:MAG: radical SAM protein [Ruminococcaceae bacterium]|nr:radical SAM protein [Oscillospiraceae bacterium]